MGEGKGGDAIVGDVIEETPKDIVAEPGESVSAGVEVSKAPGH